MLGTGYTEVNKIESVSVLTDLILREDRTVKRQTKIIINYY